MNATVNHRLDPKRFIVSDCLWETYCKLKEIRSSLFPPYLDQGGMKTDLVGWGGLPFITEQQGRLGTRPI
jgi:hypothetical protein